MKRKSLTYPQTMRKAKKVRNWKDMRNGSFIGTIDDLIICASKGSRQTVFRNGQRGTYMLTWGTISVEDETQILGSYSHKSKMHYRDESKDEIEELIKQVESSLERK